MIGGCFEAGDGDLAFDDEVGGGFALLEEGAPVCHEGRRNEGVENCRMEKWLGWGFFERESDESTRILVWGLGLWILHRVSEGAEGAQSFGLGFLDFGFRIFLGLGGGFDVAGFDDLGPGKVFAEHVG